MTEGRIAASPYGDAIGITDHNVYGYKEELMNRIFKAALTALVFTSLALAGCGGEKASGEKTVVYATTGYGREMGDAGLNPHENYSGWSTVRYGVGETLFRLSDAMTPEPWLAM